MGPEWYSQYSNSVWAWQSGDWILVGQDFPHLSRLALWPSHPASPKMGTGSVSRG